MKLSGQDSYALSGAPQGTLAMRLHLGTAVEYCGAAPAKAPPEANDTTTKFVAVSNSPAGACPAVP